MDTTVITNILFSLMSILALLLIVGFGFLIVYTIMILKKIHDIFEIIRGEAQKAVSDIEMVKNGLKSGKDAVKLFAAYVLSFFKNPFGSAKTKPSHKKSKKET